MICKKCGAKFSDGMFCPECGARTMPVSASGDGQMNMWEAAFEYSDGEEYNTKMYGPQGQLEEQRVSTTIEISAGGKKIFENKRIIFKNGIRAGNNANLEFRNCELIIDETSTESIHIGENVHILFENCVMKATRREMIVGRLYYENHENDNGAILKFRNCAFVDGRNKYLELYGSAYFENCFIETTGIAQLEKRDIMISSIWDSKRQTQTLEFRNCIITSEGNGNHLIGAYVETIVIFENCYIKTKMGLINKKDKIELNIKNSYFDDYSDNNRVRRDHFV